LYLKGSITLGEESGNTFIVFLKRGSKEIAVVLETPEIRELQRKLSRKAKQEKEWRFCLL
jgi:hypothetical protein